MRELSSDDLASKIESIQSFLNASNLSPGQARLAQALKAVAKAASRSAPFGVSTFGGPALDVPSRVGSPAQVLISLRQLDLAGDPLFPSTRPLDVAPLAQLFPKLTSLKLSHQNLENPSLLADLRELEFLDVAMCGLSDVSFVLQLKQLNSLNLSKNTTRAESVALLCMGEAALKWKGLWLDELQIRGVDFLKDCENLQELSFSRNNISTLAPLAKLTKIRSLSFDSNMVDSLDFLAKWRNLRSLSFKNNAIRDLDPLQDLSFLTHLDFSSNQVRSLKALKPLRDLQRVGCSKNPLFDDDYDAIPRSVRID